MGESTKAVCVLLFAVGAIGASVAWTTTPPTATTWAFRLGGLAIALSALGLILRLHFRRDAAHDFLNDLTRSYFNRHGFCFAFTATAVEGVAYLEAYFQNQFDSPCVGRIALRPTRRSFRRRPKMATIMHEIDCAPAPFGVVRIPIAIPLSLQGKRWPFELGASVHYPEGKGRRLRFRDGTFVRSTTSFTDSFDTAMKAASVATGSLLSLPRQGPTTTPIDLPLGVAEIVPEEHRPEMITLWELGDPIPPKID